MFIDKYLNNVKLKLLYDVYDSEYINSLDEANFIRIYEVFRKYKFYFIDDIILNYLELFMLDSWLVENKILELIDKLGNKYMYIIGSDIRYLESILE